VRSGDTVGSPSALSSYEELAQDALAQLASDHEADAQLALAQEADAQLALAHEALAQLASDQEAEAHEALA
jgi:hypothetical protein